MAPFTGGEDGLEEKAWGAEEETKQRRDREPSECIIDIREHDIAYYLRVAIDLGEWRGPLVLHEASSQVQTSELGCGTT